MSDDNPQRRGGNKRAANLTPEQRREIASKAGNARWSKFAIEPGQKLLKSVASGILNLGSAQLECAVLDDENHTRVLTQAGFLTALDRAPKPNSGGGGAVANLPVFLQAKNLESFISKELEWSSTPIVFEASKGGGLSGRSLGYRAQLLPDVCWVYHNAQIAGKLLPSQMHVAEKCTALLRALTNVAIDALVDEATGWQYLREKDDLQKLLAAYMSSELMPWTERFPREFYKEMFRLWNWQWPPANSDKGGPQGPRYAGKLTNKLVYDQLPPGVADGLKNKTPADANWQRKDRLHQWLNEEIGQPHLEKQVAVATNIMKVCDDKDEFMMKFERAFPNTFERGRQLSFHKKLSGPKDLDE
ncbi:P63C domain-containing protein [Bradyrhizobium diazoefficiens]|nr:P63C domain-containing protein [Bradyrhizobium diazoefficiens]QQO20106.1 P63C domain-containing protein [Bradyrhizobium diazoefficiens]